MNSQIDVSIPVLTEIIPPNLNDSPPTSPDAATAFLSTSTTTSVAITETISDTPTTLTSSAEHQRAVLISAEEWQVMEQNLHEAVLRQVLSRIDFVLEHRVRDNLADVLQTSVERLADEIRSGLHNTLDDIVRRAITQEISKIKSNPPNDG